ncbi:unnamed protein product [Symbiodinium sp. CCMP2592]|nr:unnamed protein product [Symbiodinium sp. CCMP2592]
MGACCALGADPISESTMSPAAAEVQLKTGEVQRVSLVPASHCYCLLIAPGSALFMDVRSRDLFDRSHVFGAWSVGTLSKAGNHGAIRSRCDLRWLVIMGSHEDPLKDERVLEILELLHDLQVRPISQRPLLLLGGVGEFQRRFPFCMRTAGKEQLEPLPVCPAEVVEPGQASVVKGAKSSKNRSLYLGSLVCLMPKNSEASRALKIAAAVRIIEESVDPDPEQGPLLPGLNICEVRMPSSAPVRSLDVEGKAGVTDDKSCSSFDRSARAVACVAAEAPGSVPGSSLSALWALERCGGGSLRESPEAFLDRRRAHRLHQGEMPRYLEPSRPGSPPLRPRGIADSPESSSPRPSRGKGTAGSNSSGSGATAAAACSTPPSAARGGKPKPPNRPSGFGQDLRPAPGGEVPPAEGEQRPGGARAAVSLRGGGLAGKSWFCQRRLYRRFGAPFVGPN